MNTANQSLGSRLSHTGDAYLEVIRSPRYFPLWLGQLVSNFGDTLHYIALVVLVFQLTGQGIAVAALVAAEILPVLLLGPVAGVVIDRFSRKAVLIGSDIVRAGLVLSLLWPQGAWHAYLVAAGIAGGLIGIFGTRVAFGLNAATFLVSALFIAQLQIPAHVGQLSESTRRGLERFFRDAQEGLRFARHDPFVSRLLLVQLLASFAVGATGAMLVVLAEEHLRLPPSGFAWLIGAIGVGALMGPLIPNALASDYRNARWLFVPYVIRGIGDILLAVVTALPPAMLILFVYGLNTSTGMVVFSSTVQGAVPDPVRGRVFALLDVSWNAMRLLSLVIGGLVVDEFGIRPLFCGGGMLLALAGILGLVLLGSFDFRQDPES